MAPCLSQAPHPYNLTATRFGLALEPSQPLLAIGHLLGLHLDRQLTIQPSVLGKLDFPHTARAQGIEDMTK